MTFKEWMETVPSVIRNDAVWRIEAYRLALFAGDLAWQDVSKLVRDKRTISLADQLNRSAGAISGNICEGYSRRSGKDQARFYEYGLGSAREARDWYYKGRHVLGEKVCNHRMELVTEVIKHLLVIIPTERGFKLQEEAGSYSIDVEVPTKGEEHISRATHHASRISYRSR